MIKLLVKYEFTWNKRITQFNVDEKQRPDKDQTLEERFEVVVL